MRQTGLAAEADANLRGRVDTMKVISSLGLFCVLLQLSCGPSANKASAELSVGQQAYDKGDYATALKEFLPLARQGNPVAQSYVGFMHENGQGVPQDYKEAVKWYRLAANQGNSYAQDNLGILYENGRGVPQDYKEAVKWFRFSAGQGNAFAQADLGAHYEYGRGVPQDYKESAKWYRLAAEQGNAFAQNKLGIHYEYGKGVPKDNVQAHLWYNLAGANGDADGITNRDRIAQRLTPVQLADAQHLALEWKPKANKFLTFDVSEVDAKPNPTATLHSPPESSDTLPVKAQPAQGSLPPPPKGYDPLDVLIAGMKSAQGSLPPPPKGYSFVDSEPTATSTAPWTVVESVLSIRDAEGAGWVRTSYRSDGSSSGDSLLLIVVKIGGPAKLVLSIPSGLALSSASQSSQSMVISGLRGREGGNGKYAPERFVTLTDDKPVRYVIEAYCAEFHKDNPPPDTFFQVSPTSNPVLACILSEARKEKLSVIATQAAVWLNTDHLTFQEMNTRMVIGSEEWSKAETVAARCNSNRD